MLDKYYSHLVFYLFSPLAVIFGHMVFIYLVIWFWSNDPISIFVIRFSNCNLTKWQPFCSKPFKNRTIFSIVGIWIQGLAFKLCFLSGCQMIGFWNFEYHSKNQTSIQMAKQDDIQNVVNRLLACIWKPNFFVPFLYGGCHLNSGYQNIFEILYVSCIWMSVLKNLQSTFLGPKLCRKWFLWHLGLGTQLFFTMYCILFKICVSWVRRLNPEGRLFNHKTEKFGK